MNAIFDATVPCFTFDLGMSDDYYRQLASWLAESRLIKQTRAPLEYWTNELV